jgi:alpha-galactosidase
MEALRDNRNFVVHVNVRNKGAILNLPHQCNVEVPALINGRGVHPFAMGELPSGIASLVRRVVDEQELMVEAALTGSRELAVQALAADALVQDIRVANQLFDAMYEAQKSYLPRFD